MELQEVFINSEESGYKSFELLTHSMDDGNRKAMAKGDVLKCRVIAEWDSLRDLSKLNYPVVIIANGRPLVGIIQQQMGVGTILLSKYNQDYKNKQVELAKVRTIYQVESFQRDMTPKALAKRERELQESSMTY